MPPPLLSAWLPLTVVSEMFEEPSANRPPPRPLWSVAPVAVLSLRLSDVRTTPAPSSEIAPPSPSVTVSAENVEPVMSTAHR